MAAVRVVTDSTASLGPGRADRTGMIVVPLQVVLDGVSAPEAAGGAGVVNITGGEVAAALRAGRTVTTSRPSPESFATCYRQLAADGATAIVSVHLSRAISGTYDAALAAAATTSVPVTVIDSGTLAMALGYAALAGAEAAVAGCTADEVAATVRDRAASTSAYFSVESLEYLRRGGRIGTAQALVGSALAVKPLLTVVDGVVAPCARVRTRTRAHARLQELALQAATAAAGGADGGTVVDLAVHHLADAGAAAEFAAGLVETARLNGVVVGELAVSEVSAVLGVHVGPGMLGVIVAPRTGP